MCDVYCESCEAPLTDAEAARYADILEYENEEAEPHCFACMEEEEEYDREYAADCILERQELEDFEGHEFYDADCEGYYDCEW